MHVRDHGADVPRAVGRLAVCGVLDAVQVVVHGLVEVHRVALVEGVDLASRGDLDLYMTWVRTVIDASWRCTMKRTSG